MAQTAVDVVVRVKDLAALERLKKSLAGVDGATLKASRGIEKFENSLKRLQGVVGGLAIGDQLRRAFGAAADFSATEARLTNVVKKYEQLAGIQELAAVSARKFGVSNAQAASDLADLGSRLGSSGANLKDINDIYEGFNTLLAVNQVGAQQAAAAQLQLNQALGAGKLAGDEFRSIAETTPQLLDELASTLGVTRAEIKKLGSDGAITSKVLVEALGNIAEDGGAALADFFKTPAGQLKLFDKAIKDFQVTVGQQLLPVFTPVISSLATLLQLFGQLPGPVKATAVAVTALGAAFAILGGPITAIIAGIIGITLIIKKLADENEAFANALQGAWDGILAGLNGVGAFFQAFFASIAKQGGDFIAYWQEIGSQIESAWNRSVQGLIEAFGRWQGYFNAVVTAIVDAWNQLVKLIPEAFLKAVNALGDIFSPFVEFLSGAFGSIFEGWNGLLKGMTENWTRALTEMIASLLPFVKIFQIIGIDIGEAIGDGISNGFKAFQSFEGIKAPSLELPGTSGLSAVTPPSGKGSKGGGSKGGTSDAERQLELQNKQLQAAKDLLFTSQNQLKGLEGITETEKLLAKTAVEKLEIERKYQELQSGKLSNEEGAILRQAEANELKANEIELEKALKGLRDGALSSIDDEIAKQQAIIAGKEKEYEVTKRIKDLVNAGGGQVSKETATAKVNQLEGLKQQAAESKKLKSQYESIASGISAEFTDAFKSIIDGTKSVNEAFAQMLKGIADKFLDMAAKIIQDALTKQLINLFKSLFGPSPGFNGVPGGRGPEFMGPAFAGGGYTGDGPRTGGVDGKGGFPAILHPQETVVDHYDDARNAMSTSAANSTAFAEAESAMAMASSNYVMNTTTVTGTGTSDGPGGSSGPIQIQTNVINKVEYATVEEVNKGMQMSAKQAEANVFRSMRNKPATRNRVGV